MSKENVDGLETVETTKTEKEVKVQTPEEKETLEAGVETIKTLGVSKDLEKVLDLVPIWKDKQSEELAAAKAAVIETFGGSEKFKDYFDTQFDTDSIGVIGLAKAIPVLNSIKAFYARRKNSGSVSKKSIQISIAGTTYSVSAAYRDEIADFPAEKRKELLLAHPQTKAVEVIEEIL